MFELVTASSVAKRRELRRMNKLCSDRQKIRRRLVARDQCSHNINSLTGDRVWSLLMWSVSVGMVCDGNSVRTCDVDLHCGAGSIWVADGG